MSSDRPITVFIRISDLILDLEYWRYHSKLSDCFVQVAYATALDVFIIICFMSVFTALIEFAFINFLDMFIRRLKHRDLVRVVTLTDMTRSMTAPLVRRERGELMRETGFITRFTSIRWR